VNVGEKGGGNDTLAALKQKSRRAYKIRERKGMECRTDIKMLAREAPGQSVVGFLGGNIGWDLLDLTEG